MLQERISGGFRIAVVLFALAIVHFLGSILSHFWIFSDLLLVVGAYQVVKVLRDESALNNVKRSVNDFQLGALADGITNQVLELLSMFGLDIDRDGDFDEDDLIALKEKGVRFISIDEILSEGNLNGEVKVEDDTKDLAL